MATKKTATEALEEEVELIPLDAGGLKVSLDEQELEEGLVVDVPVQVLTHREYHLELFEQGDNRVFGRQRGLAREGWDFPIIHGFTRTFPMGNRPPDSFLILVASRDVEVPA